MGTIKLSFSNNSKSKNKNIEPKNKQKVLLTYHDCIDAVPEYFTYINDNDDEVKLTDKSYVITKISSSKYIGKKSFVSQVPLTYVAGQESIDFKPAFFTYNDNEVYLDNPIYDNETNSYKGILEVVNIYDKEIRLYEE